LRDWQRESEWSVVQHLSPDQLEKYRTGKLAGADLMAADDHIAVCPECRNHLSRPLVLESRWRAVAQGILLTAAPETPHVSYEQLSHYVDGAATPVEAAQLELHIRDCATCRAEMEDLRRFVQELKVRTMPRRSRIYFVLAAVAAALVIGAFLFWPHRSEPQLAISLQDGASVLGLDKEGHLSAPASIPESDRQALATVLRDGTLAVSTQESLRRNRSVLLGPSSDPNKFHLTSPVGEMVLATTPEFRWQRLDGAQSYRVEVFDSNYRVVLKSPELTEVSWSPVQPLERDRVYVWQVTARRQGSSFRTPQPPDPEARFQILGAPQADALERTRNISPPSHLLLAIRFANAGLCRDALGEIGALEGANPHSTVLAKVRGNITAQCKLDGGTEKSNGSPGN
jgi:Putative zinc-finger